MSAKDVKKRIALTLYMEGYNLTDIADTLDVAISTISRWVSKNGWDDRRKLKLDMVNLNHERVLKAISHNLTIIDKKMNEEPDKMITKGDIDALSKLHAMSKEKSDPFEAYVRIQKEFIEYLQGEDLSLAKQILVYSRSFLETKKDKL